MKNCSEDTYRTLAASRFLFDGDGAKGVEDRAP
jgi:peptide subunit release factor RF-3